MIVCGSDDALSYVRRAAEAANESLEVIPFTRKSPLLLLEEPVPLEKVEAGDAVLTFTGTPVMLAAVVYGGQPLDLLDVQGDLELAARFVTLFPLPAKLI